MTGSDRWYAGGFYLAGTINIVGMLVFSRFFTNELLTATQPTLFSVPSMMLVILWGCAYIAVAHRQGATLGLCLVFGLEKVFYATTGIGWLFTSAASLPSLFAQDPLTGLYYAAYGTADGMVGLFFFAAAYRHYRGGREEQAQPASS